MTPRKLPGLLFLHEPPEGEFLVESFWNRERELRVALMPLLDADERRIHRQLWAVHGETRTGKSHLVRRVFADQRVHDSGFRVWTVQANNRGNARSVLEETFRRLWKAVEALPPNASVGLSDEELSRVRQRLGDVTRVLDGVADLQVGVTDSEARGATGGFWFGEKGIAGVTGEARAQTEQKIERRETLRSLGDEQLVVAIARTLEVLVKSNRPGPVVLFVDDVDLLARDGREGGDESERLVDLLRPLADVTGAIVVVTTRHLFFSGRQKDFYDFIEVRTLPVDALLKIYQLRVDLFHAGEEVFTPDAIDFLAKHSNGRIGMLLRYCAQIYKDRGREVPITREHIDEYLRGEVEHWLRLEGTRPLVNQVRNHLKVARSYEIEPVVDPGRVGLLNRLLYYVPGNGRTFAISRMYSRLLREMPDDAFE